MSCFFLLSISNANYFFILAVFIMVVAEEVNVLVFEPSKSHIYSTGTGNATLR